MMNKGIASVALLAVSISVAMHSYAEGEGASSPVDATNTLPDAKPGECFAKVIVPATYETSTQEVVVQPEQETVEIIPATFDAAEQEIETRPAYTKLKAVPAKYRSEEELVETEPARNEWVTSLGRKGIPASPALLVAAKTSGIEIDAAQPGACYREFYMPAKFEQNDKKVEVKESSENIVIKAAEFEASEESVTTKPAYNVKKSIAAVYDKIEEKVLIEPAKAVWKKGSGLVERIDNTTGEIMCLVQVPARYDTFLKTVLKSAATIQDSEVSAVTKAIKTTKLVTDATSEKVPVEAEFTTVTTRAKVADAQFSWRPVAEEGEGAYTGLQVCLKGIPAKQQTVKKLVLDTPASVEEEKVAAETKVVKTEKVATAAEIVRTSVPAQSKAVELRKKVSSEKLEWRRVLCQTNMTKELNIKIQQALKDAGYYNGPVDGSIGRGTLNSVNKYQVDKDLPRGGLTIKVLEDLGLM
ncbi:MAG: peptidoglycan-binding domain-containing protein [Thiotrichaceae bacterium]